MADETTRADDRKYASNSADQVEDDPIGRITPFLNSRVGARAAALTGVVVALGEAVGTHTSGSISLW